MNRLVFTTIVSGALAMAALGFPASASAAPAGVGSAQDLLNTLVSDGYKVVLMTVGAGPLDQCTVGSVRSGETVYRTVRTGAGDNLVNQIAYQSVYLTANC